MSCFTALGYQIALLLHPVNGVKLKIYNNISLTEFSNVTGHFMEDVNTRYGRRKHTTN